MSSQQKTTSYVNRALIPSPLYYGVSVCASLRPTKLAKEMKSIPGVCSFPCLKAVNGPSLRSGGKVHSAKVLNSNADCSKKNTGN